MTRCSAHLNQLLHTDFSSMAGADGQGGTLTAGDKSVEYRIKALYNDKKELQGVFVFCL